MDKQLNNLMTFNIIILKDQFSFKIWYNLNFQGDIHSQAEFYGNHKTDEFQCRPQHRKSGTPADITRAEQLSFRTQLNILE